MCAPLPTHLHAPHCAHVMATPGLDMLRTPANSRLRHCPTTGKRELEELEAAMQELEEAESVGDAGAPRLHELGGRAAADQT